MLIYFAVSLLALFGFCGLAIDVSRMEARTLQLQTAADNAAMAYAVEYGRLGNVSNSLFNSAANAELAVYATANGIPTPALTIQKGASSGPFVNNLATVQTTVQQTVPTMLLGALSGGSSSMLLTRTAVAALPPCSTVYGSLTLSNNAILNVPCSLAVGTGITMDGSARINGQMLVEGPAAASSVSGVTTPNPSYNWPSEKHPISYTGSSGVYGCSSASTPINNDPSATLSPGLYCALQISHSTVTLAAGDYSINGGLTITNSTIQGGPAHILLGDDPPTYGAGQFILDHSQWNVSAPTTSGSIVYASVCLARLQPDVPAGTPAMLVTNSTITSDGIYSFSGSTMSFVNSTIHDAGHSLRFTVGNLNVSSSQLTLSNDYSQLPGGSGMAFTTPLLQ